VVKAAAQVSTQSWDAASIAGAAVRSAAQAPEAATMSCPNGYAVRVQCAARLLQMSKPWACAVGCLHCAVLLIMAAMSKG